MSRRDIARWRGSARFRLILCAASACGTSVPGQAGKGTPGADSTASRPAVPAAAWLDADALPLNDREHWPDLANVAQPVTDGAFEMQTRSSAVFAGRGRLPVTPRFSPR
jgi:hypothetical protein